MKCGYCDLDATTLRLSDSLFGICDDGWFLMLKDHTISKKWWYSPFSIFFDPASWHVWYLELVTRASSLKHYYPTPDVSYRMGVELEREGGLTWTVDYI